MDLGLDPYGVDAAISGFGMPMGPFRLSDLVGADVGLHVGSNFVGAFAERVYPAGIIQLLNDARRLGEKTGAGEAGGWGCVWRGVCVCARSLFELVALPPAVGGFAGAAAVALRVVACPPPPSP